MNEFAVVICAHAGERWTYLQRAVQSIRRQTLQPREVLVVIDRNDVLFRRASAALEGVRVIRNADDPGLGGARNSGIAASTATLIAFIDDDAVASSRWLELLAGPYGDPDVSGVGGAIEPVWESGRPAWFPEEFDWVVGCTYRGMPENACEVRNLIGCNMSFRRDVLDALGRFRLGYGCDETELCIRLRQRWPEKKLLYVPDATVSHYVPAARARFSRFLARCYFEGGSKAVVSHLVGSEQGLASERSYARRTLPHAVLAGVEAMMHNRDAAGIARSATIVLGFAATATGYIRGRTSVAQAATRRGWSGEPIVGGGALGRVPLD